MPAPLPRTRTLLTTRRHWRKRVSVRRCASGRAHYNYFRDYDPTSGRYTQSDPIGLRSGINTFAYAGNEPIQQFDPRGLAYTAVRSGNTITIYVSITIYGPRASDTLAKSWESAINSRWNGFMFGNCKVEVKARVRADSRSNWWFTAAAAANKVFVSDPSERSYVRNGSLGDWRENAGGNVAAHEFGHLLGLDDDYTDTGGTNAGHVGHMMGDMSQVDQHEIDDVLERWRCACGK